LPAGLCTTEALQKWLATPESVRYSTPAAGVPPNAWPLGELTGCSGVSTAEPGPAAVVAAASAPGLLVVGAGAALWGSGLLPAPAADVDEAVPDAAAEDDESPAEVAGELPVGPAEAGVDWPASADRSAVKARAEECEMLSATPSIPAMTTSPAIPAATAARRARARFRSRMRCCLRATRERPPGASIDASLRSRPASGRLAFHDECRLRRRLRSAEPFTTRSTQIPALAEPRIR